MKLQSAVALLLLTVSAASAQPPPPPGELRNYSLDADNFVDARIKISAQFQFPLGVEWIKSADTLKPVRLPEGRATAADVIQAVVSLHAGYAWRTEDGVVHVFQKNLASDPRNPLNIILKSFDERSESVAMANNNLFNVLNRRVRHPADPEGSLGSVLGGVGAPVCRFAVENAPARNILNQMVKCDFPSPAANPVWIATFPEKPLLSGAGFLEVQPVLNPNPDRDQPFWFLLGWHTPPSQGMVR